MTDKLKELALAAKECGGNWFHAKLMKSLCENDEDAAYIAAASPDAILALIKRAEDAEAKNADMFGKWEAECELTTQLRAEVERLKAQEPYGYVYGNSFWEASNPRITSDAIQYGRKLYLAPGAAPAQEPVAWLISSKDWWPESVAVTQKPTGLLGNETLQPLFLASGAAQKEPIQDVAMHVLTSIGGIDYDTAKSLVENAYGAAQKEQG